MQRLKSPILLSVQISFPELWYITEDNGDVRHYRFLEISLMQRGEDKALQIIVGWLAIAVAWIGFR